LFLQIVRFQKKICSDISIACQLQNIAAVLTGYSTKHPLRNSRQLL